MQLFLGLFEPTVDPPIEFPDAPIPPVSTGEDSKSDSGDPPGSSKHGWDGLGSEVVFEFPARLRKTWRLVKRRGKWICQLPPPFQQAPPEVRQDLLVWIKAVLHPSPGSRGRKKQAQTRIFQWMSPLSPDKVPKSRSKGKYWDLDELFQGLNHRYFDGALRAVVRWSPQLGGLSTHRKLQTETGSHHLLTISLAYDGRTVPRQAVEGVLFHEMCHIAHPPKSNGGSRRHVHHKEFRDAERRYDGFEAWRKWEATNMHRELKILRKGLAK